MVEDGNLTKLQSVLEYEHEATMPDSFIQKKGMKKKFFL